MTLNFVILNLIQWFSAVLMLGLAFYSLRFRDMPQARALLAFFILCGIWAFFAALIPHLPDFETKVILNRIKLTSPTLLPFSILFLAKSFHGTRKWPHWVWFIFSVTPLLGVGLIISPYHEYFVGAYRTSFHHGHEVLEFSSGPWFKVHNIQARIITLLSMFLIVTANRNLHSYHRHKVWLISIAIFAPFLIDTIAVMYYETLRFLQLTPALLALSAVVMAYAVFERNILELIPLARSQILDNTPDLYLVFDGRDRLVDFNAAAQNVLHLSQDAMGTMRDRVFQNEKGLYEHTSAGNHGVRHWQKGKEFYEVIQKPLGDGIVEPIGTLVIMKNVSLQKKVEMDLHEINEMKTKLMAVMGHDLQSTLAGLALTTENLASRIETYEPEDLNALLESLCYSARSCVSLIDQLLIWSKSQLGVLQATPENFHIEELVNATLNFLQPAIIEKNIQVSFESSLNQPIRSDSNMIQVVIRNLLSNSVKFTPENGSITIHIKDLDPFLQVSVLDSGVGIDPSREKVIFDLNKDHHSGIGLYLCSEFIKRLSGRIWSESSQGQGGVFHFIIPKTLRDPMKPQSSTQNPRDALDPNFGLRPSWLHQLNQTPSA